MAEKGSWPENFEPLDFTEDLGQRRDLRSDYLAVRNTASERRDDLGNLDSPKLDMIIDTVNKLHEQVKFPREQVADAEALLDITNAVVASVMSYSIGEITPTDFVSGLITHFGQAKRTSLNTDTIQVSLNWKDIGLSVSPIFKRVHGCCTMLGPMNTAFKQRKAAVRRTKPGITQLAEKVNDNEGERTDTDLNMATMFEILKKRRNVELSCLVLNRSSFAQTVENIFALSFLAKDGRVKISVDADGTHIVSPTNGPVANQVAYHHFMFRLDFKDWKLMKDKVAVGEELMPHRNNTKFTPASEEEPAAHNSQTAPHTTLIRESSAEDIFESGGADGDTEHRGSKRGPKRKLSFDACLSGSLN